MREAYNFCRGWRFHKGDVAGGETAGCDDADWESVLLPHSWNAADTFTPARGYYRGAGWYRKRFPLTEEEAARTTRILFGAGFAVADVWVNERFVNRYMGGFTGFVVDASWLAQPGENLIAIRLDNSHDPEVLPGRETPDYNLYGGLYREAELRLQDRLYIPPYGVRVNTPEVREAEAAAWVSVVVQNDDDHARACTCIVEVRDPTGAVVARAQERGRVEPAERHVFFGAMEGLKRPALWSPDSSALYTARVRIKEKGTLLDEDEARFGFRWFQFTADKGLFLNGHPLKLRGVNRHQDYPGLGNAVPVALQQRDAEIIKEMGGNFVRASHYPQHPAFLDACDRLGIIVYEEIASWQHIGGEQFARNAECMLLEMIQRDGNHPAILLWGLLNEGRSRDLFEQLNATAHALDRSRATVYAENRPEEGRELGTVEVPDVLGINYKLPHLDEIHAGLPQCKLLCSEHTNADFAVRGDLDAELKQLEKLKTDTDIIEARAYVAGGALWSMHDYGTDYEPVWPCQHSGVLDACRLPKEGYHYLKSRWSKEPMVHICGHWTWPGREGRTRTVTVVSNCDIVELLLNGRALGVQARKNPMCWEVEYEPGVLEAEAHKGDVMVRHRIETAGPAAALRLSASRLEIAANGSDATEVTVEMVDVKGVRVPTATDTVAFAVDGPAVVHGIGGRASTPVEAGVGRIVVQATTAPGSVTLFASCLGLEAARTEFMTVPCEGPPAR